MKVLVINCGSSSLKYQLIDSETESVLAKGLCERIGIDGALTHQPAGKDKIKSTPAMPDHKTAIGIVIDQLTDKENGVVESLDEIGAVGHRIVHGGEKFTKSCLITDEVIKEVEECSVFAPLHNPAGLIGVRACQELMPGLPMVAVFDTAFHQTMPEKAFLYGIPRKYYDEDGIRRYVHLGTGNYNDSTAKLYTDCGIFTCDGAIGEDATAVFNMLSGYSEPLSWNELAVAPIWLRTKFTKLIRRETKHAKEGKPAKIIAKMNSLCDPGIIESLYEASAAGVKIQLIVRGICCLKVGIPGVSENIEVRSIVGNFLEHSRIFYFFNDGEEELYMGSADWMPRNLDRRVEILFPVLDDELKKRVRHILDVELADTLKAHVLHADGNYEKVDRRGKIALSSQDVFCREAMENVSKPSHGYQGRVFIPAEPVE